MSTAHELLILKHYSTPGLRKNTLDLQAKRDHLRRLGIKADDVQKILIELYPEETAQQADTIAPAGAP